MADAHPSVGWPLPLPKRDHVRSPETGVVREHWEAVADNLLLAALRYRSPQGGRIDLPGEPERAGYASDGLEGYARTFLLAAFRVAGAKGEDPHGFLPAYAEGLVAGTDPRRGTDAWHADPELWQPIGDVGPGGQPMVESASIAIGLQLTRPWIWDRLDARERDHVEQWLRGAFRHEPAPNNWYLFPFTVAAFLESVGRGDDETKRAVERAIQLLDQWYRGDGWYSDGDGRAFDHYAGWAMHFYPLVFGMQFASDPAYADVIEGFRRRARRFIGSYALTFDRNGAPLYFGRSLTYRTATAASLAIAEVAGCSPLRPGQSRRIINGTLSYFLQHGAVDRNGLFTRGWHGAHPASLQDYSGPASPYWASKGFVGLLLDSDAPLWSATEEGLDGDGEDSTTPLPEVGWLIQRTGADGLVRVHNHGSDHVVAGAADGGQPDPLYARTAYSTRTGPSSVRNSSDNDVQVVFRGVPSVRRRISPIGAGPDWAASSHVPRFPLPVAILGGGAPGSTGPVLPAARIDSLVIARGAWEVRANRFVNIPPGSPIRISGWALSGDGPDELAETVDPSDAPGVTVEDARLVSTLRAVAGWSSAATRRAPAGTAFGRWALIPELTGTSGSGITVALARLTSSENREAAPAPTVHVDEHGFDVVWVDGAHHVEWDARTPLIRWTEARTETETAR